MQNFFGVKDLQRQGVLSYGRRLPNSEAARESFAVINLDIAALCLPRCVRWVPKLKLFNMRPASRILRVASCTKISVSGSVRGATTARTTAGRVQSCRIHRITTPRSLCNLSSRAAGIATMGYLAARCISNTSVKVPASDLPDLPHAPPYPCPFLTEEERNTYLEPFGLLFQTLMRWNASWQTSKTLHKPKTTTPSRMYHEIRPR
ncbi:hypothetical protein C8Q78DRAFT_788647 [Trametes maxima]|nr:hypothetical protein C8Q78DRAFT_788647 [Trametes maxima]